MFEYYTHHIGLDTGNHIIMKTTLLDQLPKSSEERFKADDQHIRINSLNYTAESLSNIIS
jgi:hypothetical protein